MTEFRSFVTTCDDKDSARLEGLADDWVALAARNKLSYEVDWLGIPVIQTPEDLVLMQELLYRVNPDIVVEVGVAHGGGLIYYASILELLGKGKVIGVEIDFREHNRKVVEQHKFYHRISIVEGSSVDEKVFSSVQSLIPKGAKTVVCLDSNHTRKHVLAELELYSKIVSLGSYLVVFDTMTSDLARKGIADKAYVDNGPMEAIDDFLEMNRGFTIDKHYNKFYISHSQNGYLKRVS